MDQHDFIALKRSLQVPSRRDVLHGLAGAGIGLAALASWQFGDSAAKSNKKNKTKRKRKGQKKRRPRSPQVPPPFNTFGCLDAGQPCQGDSALCCSGVCDPGTATCVAHSSGICSSDTDTCTLGQGVPCQVNNDSICSCFRTTGNAGFCGHFLSDGGACRVCNKDTDCQEEFGPGAACVVLEGLCSPTCATTGHTACMTPCV